MALSFQQQTPETEAAFRLVMQALDVEVALLGCLIEHPGALSEADRLDPADFYSNDGLSLHGRLFMAMREAHERGVEAGLAALNAQFAADLQEEPSFLFNAVNKAPPLTQLPGLVQQIAAASSQRRLGRLLRPGISAAELHDIVQGEATRLGAITARGKSLSATPFGWVDPSTLPVREWLYDHHLIRRFVSATFAAGGVGKTTLLIVEALSMVTGKPLLGVRPRQPLSVWLINLEDPREEIERRVAAACRYFRITPEDIGGRLFIDSGREAELVVARSARGGVEVCTPCVRQLEREIVQRKIDVLVVDPFVASHEVSENDNGAINVVTKQFAGIADRTGCAVELVHHVRKPATGQAEVTVEDGRGASALLAGVRSARVINGMSEAQAVEWGIEKRRSFIRIDNGKANLAPPPEAANWRQLISVDLENGPPGLSDLVAVAAPWTPPNPFLDVKASDLHAVQKAVSAGDYRANEQAAAWVGHAIAEQLGWNVCDARDKGRIKSLLKGWFTSGALSIEQRIDDASRKPKPFVVVGEWAQS